VGPIVTHRGGYYESDAPSLSRHRCVGTAVCGATKCFLPGLAGIVSERAPTVARQQPLELAIMLSRCRVDYRQSGVVGWWRPNTYLGAAAELTIAMWDNCSDADSGAFEQRLNIPEPKNIQ
jgi:hypothetical protein